MIKIKRKIMKLIWRESFYIYLWADAWLNSHKAKMIITIDSRDYRETDVHIDRTGR